MSSLWKTPKMPTIITPTPPPLPAPMPAEPIVKEEEIKKIRKKIGQTILTGPQGILTRPPVIRKFLLGE